MTSSGDSEIAGNKEQRNFEPDDFFRRLGNCGQQRAASFPVGTRPGATGPTRPTISKLTEGRGNAAFFVFWRERMADGARGLARVK